MREILFRGKRVDNGEWVYGQYLKREYPSFTDYSIWAPSGTIPVIPKTIGQFTSLLDKNGIKVFEGDKVKFHYFYQGYINGGAIECEKEIDGVIEIRELGLFLKCENEDEGGYLLFYQPHEESFEII